MNRRLEELLTKVRQLTDDEQSAVADIVSDYLQAQASDDWLSPEQMAEIERRLSDRRPYASDEEVRAAFDRLSR